MTLSCDSHDRGDANEAAGYRTWRRRTRRDDPLDARVLTGRFASLRREAKLMLRMMGAEAGAVRALPVHWQPEREVPINMRTCVGIGECRPECPALRVVCNMVDGHDGSEDVSRLTRRGGLGLLRRDNARAAPCSAHSIDTRLLAEPPIARPVPGSRASASQPAHEILSAPSTSGPLPQWQAAGRGYCGLLLPALLLT
jgi:hypothetical protein